MIDEDTLFVIGVNELRDFLSQEKVKFGNPMTIKDLACRLESITSDPEAFFVRLSKTILYDTNGKARYLP